MSPRRAIAITAALYVYGCTGCDWSLHRMVDQPRCEPGEETPHFADGRCEQPVPAGTVPFVGPAPGAQEEEPARRRRPAVTRTLLERGRGRFDIFCAPCHGHLGTGDTQVAENMQLKPPTDLHDPRLRAASDQHFYRVISNGWGLMPSYASSLEPADRWAVVEYVRVLQLSQDAALAELPPGLRQEARRWLP